MLVMMVMLIKMCIVYDDDEDCDDLITIMMVPIIVCTPVCLPFLI